MGIMNKLKDIYFSWEDKWYKTIERIDEKIPVYNLIERIDKIVPSFALFLVIVFLLVLFLFVSFIIPLLMPLQPTFAVRVLNQDNIPVSSISVELYNSRTQETTTLNTDADGYTEPIKVSLGDEINILIEDNAYSNSPYQESITITEPTTTQKITLEELAVTGKEITFTLVDEYQQPITTEVQIEFSCSNPLAADPATQLISTGEGTVIVPDNCETLTFNATATGFKSKIDEPLSDGQTITLETDASVFKGALTVEVKYNDILVEEPLEVRLYEIDSSAAAEGSYYDSEFLVNGQAIFENIAPGEYYAKTEETTSFGAKQSEIITMGENDSKKITLNLEKNIVGKIKVQVKDKTTKELLEDATVTLKLVNSEISSKTTNLDDNAVIEFNVSQDASYTLIITKDNYCRKVLTGIQVSSATIQAELEKDSGQCGGKLKVKVVQPDGTPVINAKVDLYNEQGYKEGYPQKTTDVNGETEFNDIPSKTYKVFAFKGSVSGWSDAMEFVRENPETVYTVTMNIPDATVRIKATDKDNEPLQFALVSLFNVIGLKQEEGPMPIESPEGIIDITTKADKTVYSIITKENYTNYTTVKRKLNPMTTTEFDAQLEPKIISGEITVEFKGLFKENKEVRILNAGEEYTAKFLVKIPSNSDYKRIGFHLRTGKTNMMERDQIMIKSINIASPSNIIKSTSFNPSEGYNYDSQFTSMDGSKWVNIELENFKTGIIEVEATIKVKDTAKQREELPVYWRAWGIKQDDTIARFPEDTTLGNSYSDADLYANTKSKTYQVGLETLCTELWCFNATFFDLEQQLESNALEGAEAKIGKTYKINFTIINNSKHSTDTYPASEIKITDETKALQLKDYSITKTNNQTVNGTANDYKTPWIQAGDIGLEKTIKGTIYFTPIKSGNIPLTIEIKSNYRIKFNKIININVLAPNTFILEFKDQDKYKEEPGLLPSGKENTLTLRVKDALTQLEVSNATIKIKNKFKDTLNETTTNSLGIAQITLPAMIPGEKLTVNVSKPEYQELEKEVQVDDKLLTFNPIELTANLNNKTNLTVDLPLVIENKSGLDLTIDELYLDGDFKELINEEASRDWLTTEFKGKKINALSSTPITVKVTVSELAKTLEKNSQSEGKLKITVTGEGHSWQYELPLKVSVGVGGETDNLDCLNISKTAWETSTQGKPVTLNLTIQNNCSIQGTPIDLGTLSGKIEWKTNHIGSFTVNIDGREIELRPGYFKALRGKMPIEATLPATLTFKPEAGIVGTAEATITLQAENITPTGKQLLTKTIDAKIYIVNIEDCIRIDKDIITIKKDATEGLFNIETKDCGTNVRFKFDTDLTLGKQETTLKGTDTQEIQVLREGKQPGQYPIYVSTKAAGQTQWQLRKTLRVRIEGEGCIALNRYEFDIYDDPNNPYDGFDTAKIINKCKEKYYDVTLKYNDKDWGEAMKDALLWAVAGGVIGATNTNSNKDCGKGEKFNKKTNKCEKEPKNKDKDNTGEKPTAGGEAENTGTTSPDTTNDSSSGSEGTSSDNPGGVSVAPPKTVLFPTNPTGLQAAGGYNPFGQMMGSIMNPISMVMSALLQPQSWWGGALTYFVLGTWLNYSNQKKGEFKVQVKDVDLTIRDVKLLVGKILLAAPDASGGGNTGDNVRPGNGSNGETGGTDTGNGSAYKGIEDTDIAVKTGEVRKEVNEENPKLNNEEMELIFVNTTGITQDDALHPLYRTLRIEGDRHEYQLRYTHSHNGSKKLKNLLKDYGKDYSLKETGKDNYFEEFNLQFNSFRFEKPAPTIVPEKECYLAGERGTTGESALPKIKLKWGWNEIKQDNCDTTNENSVFCDATQFTIELMKKIHRINELLSGQNLNCPTGTPEKATQEISSYEKDIAVTELSVSKDSKTTKIKAKIESNNEQKVLVKALIKVKNNASNEETICSEGEKDVNLISQEIVSCNFDDLPTGKYTASITISPQLSSCTNCENNNTENDSLSLEFNQGSTGTQKCKPYSTKRITEFAAANPNNASLKEVVNLVKFQANLMSDGYTQDFRKDFDFYSKTKDFFGAPTYYKDETNGLGLYLADNDLVKFKSAFLTTPYSSIPAGVYDVTININYNNASWKLFENNQADAVIEIELERLSTPSPDSPFYYMPFDGLIGTIVRGEEEAAGRQGYGINFSQETLDNIRINESTSMPVYSVPIAGSNPIPGGIVKTSKIKNFQTMNIDNRGILLDVTRNTAANEIRLKIAPSNPTPVIMEVEGGKTDKAFAFYDLTIEGGLQNPGSSLSKWSGLTVGCLDFSNQDISDAFGFEGTGDIPGGIDFASGGPQCATGTRIGDYGFEWCNIRNSGKVFLSTVFFTPENKNAVLRITRGQDSATFITPNISGKTVELTGSFNQSIDSVEKILDLVKEKKVCVSGIGSSITEKFYWNPKALIDSTMENVINDIPNQCIAG